MPTHKDRCSADARRLTRWAYDMAAIGCAPLSSAYDLAHEYMLDKALANHDAQAARLVREETSRHFTTGFLVGLGGIVEPPDPCAAPLAAALFIQARVAAAVAVIYGHRLGDPRTAALVRISLGGDIEERFGTESLGGEIAAMSESDLEATADSAAANLLCTNGTECDLEHLLIGAGCEEDLVDATICYATGRAAIRLFGTTRRTTATAPGVHLGYWEPPS